jgi:hypothetical protein
LILNKTNAGSIAALHGVETDDWAGKTVVLITDTTHYQGKRVGCIRIDERASGAPKGAGKRPAADVINDSLPF